MKNLMKWLGIKKILKAKHILPEKVNQFMLINLITNMKKLSIITLIKKNKINGYCK